jgi:hypothetical protein
MKDILEDIIPFIGFILLTTGLWLWNYQACLVIDGVLLMAFGLFLNMPKRKI